MAAAAPRVARPHRRAAPAAAFADFPPEFFDLRTRLIALPALKILLCAPEKNAGTTLHAVAHVANGVARGTQDWTAPTRLPQAAEFWWAFTPAAANLSAAAVRRILRRPPPHHDRWRTAVVWRDPLERFVSSYESKCAGGDHDGGINCEQYFGLEASPTMEAVATALLRRREAPCGWNPHWAPQACFCGGLSSDFCAYGRRIRFGRDMGPSVHALFEGRVGAATLREIDAEMREATTVPAAKVVVRRKHGGRRGGGGGARNATWALRTMVAELYASDYSMLKSGERCGEGRSRSPP